MSETPSLDRHLAAGGDPSALPTALRATIADIHAQLEARLDAGDSGQALNELHSDLIDRLLRRLFALAESEFYEEAGEPDGRLAVIAVGGYARREMALHSDIDLLFLYDGKLTSYLKHLTERIQYALWDAGLQVGCATRTRRETIKLAKEDATVATGILDVRFLVGDVGLFHEFSDAVRRELVADPRGFIAQTLMGVYDRHKKYGESLYLLQPNLKEGAGGLRDYHAAYWVARAAHPVKGVEDLLHYGLLTESEMEEYREALQFLWRVRYELHRVSRRKNEQLSFELQEQLADTLGYAAREGPELPVERFMRDYYRHARAIQQYSEIVMEQCSARTRRDAPRGEPRTIEGGFRIAGDQLEIPHAAFLKEQPRRLMQAFQLAEQHDVPLSRIAQRFVREHLHLVDAAYQADLEISAAFQSILASTNRVMRTLMSMNETGLLGAYLPEWEHIVCRWQHVIYHTYTVDVHSIFLVEQLRRLWKGEYEDALPDLTALIHTEEDKPALFLACLLHDVGKGRGGDHSRKGAVLARECCERLGISKERTERVVFLVDKHLLMSHLAQRRDLSDPKLIVDFARTCGDRRQLRMLYLLTMADIRASSTSAWNEWKGQLLRELFERTSEFLETGADDAGRASELIERRVEIRRGSAREVLVEAGVAEGPIEAYFDMMPRRYFISHTPRQIARHAAVVLAFGPGRPLQMSVRSMRGDFSELIVCAPDRHALYASVAGAITARGINILGSHVYTTRSGLALEIYRLTTPPGGDEERQRVWADLEQFLGEVLSDRVELAPLLRARRRPVGLVRLPSHKPPSVEITNGESDFYTIVDVSTNDRAGLLYDLTNAIAEQGYEIYISKATTVLDQVADTFYLKDEKGGKIMGALRLETLRSALMDVVREPDAAASENA